MARLCHCGCGESLRGRRADAKWATSSCSARAAERRAEDGPERFAPDAFWAGVAAVMRRHRLSES